MLSMKPTAFNILFRENAAEDLGHRPRRGARAYVPPPVKAGGG